MLNWSEGDLHVNGVRLHYYRSGADKPPLVFVHGFTDNALYWTRAALALEPEFDVVAYDARGHGKSDRAGGRFGDDERVGDLLGLIEALKLQKPVLIGHSMGAATITLAAARQPELPRCIVLEDPAWFEPTPMESPEDAAVRAEARAKEIEDWREWVRNIQTSPREVGLEAVRAAHPEWDEFDMNLSLNARQQVELDLFNHFPRSRWPWRPVVAQIECPALLLIGERERGGIISPEQAQEAATLWRQGRWMQIQDAGHSIRYDQFERYLEAVRAFLMETA